MEKRVYNKSNLLISQQNLIHMEAYRGSIAFLEVFDVYRAYFKEYKAYKGFRDGGVWTSKRTRYVSFLSSRE